MEYLKLIQDIFTGLGSIGVLVVVFAFWKMGFFDKSKNGNGTNGYAKATQLDELKDSLETIQGNHLQHIADKLDRVVEQNTEQLIILRDIKQDIKK